MNFLGVTQGPFRVEYNVCISTLSYFKHQRDFVHLYLRVQSIEPKICGSV